MEPVAFYLKVPLMGRFGVIFGKCVEGFFNSNKDFTVYYCIAYEYTDQLVKGNLPLTTVQIHRDNVAAIGSVPEDIKAKLDMIEKALLAAQELK